MTLLPSLLLLIAPGMLTAPWTAQQGFTRATATGRFEVTVHATAEGHNLTVHADNAPVEQVVRNIARQLDLQVLGFEDVAVSEPVGLYIEERPFSEAMHWILGTAGLRVQLTDDTIHVFDDTPPFPTSEDLFDLAEVAWIRALRHNPDRPEGLRAEMALAEIQESRGALAAAVNHYEYLAEKNPDSEYAPEAMLLAGIHLGELGEWDAAAKRFRALTRLTQPHPYQALARLELTRALCYAHQPTSALYTLDALEHHYPPTSDQDKRARLVLRGRALALLGEAIEALRALDLAERYTLGEQPGVEILEIRSMALERAARFGEASVAWLQLAEQTTAPLRESALENAARCALKAGDELGVLFIEAWAEKLGSEAPITGYAVEARLRIGLETDSIVHLDNEQRLAHSKQLLDAGMADQSVRTLQALYQQRERLSEPLLLDVALTYAQALDAESLSDMAIAVLRETAPRLSQRDDRRRLYLRASTIHEDNGRLQAALDALEGKL